MSEQLIDSNGRIALPSPVMAAIGKKPMGLISFSPMHVLVGSSETVVPTVAGTLGDVTVTDLLSFYNMFRKEGSILFSLKGGNRELFFEGGEVVYAESTFVNENLPEVLYDLGKINETTLKKIHEIGGTNQSVGKVLVEKGVITTKDLWLASRQQVESIVFNLFAFLEGGFCFLSDNIDQDKVVRLSMNTQNMIMEGLRRVDERALYMRDISSLDSVPVLSDQRGQKLDEQEEMLVDLIREGRANVKEILRRSGLGEFEALRTLHQLLRNKVIVLETPVVAEAKGELGDLVAIFNGALVALTRQITVANSEFVEEVQAFLRDLPQPYSYVFRDVNVQEDGSVDGGRIMGNLDGLEEGDKKRLLADSLSELIYMECLSAKESLPADESADLIKRVQKISERIKGLVGRSE
jgi:hypothetical protein